MHPTPQTYAELLHAYDVFNRELFGGELPQCLLTLQREKRTYGYFSSKRFGRRDGETTDEIALNPEYFAVVPLVEILQTIAHEMVHLWQAHFGTPGRARYHNHEWANKMESIGLMPSSTGQPGGRRVGDRVADYVIPGGRFAKVVAELLSDGRFGITWYDRVVPLQSAYVAPAPLHAAGLPSQALEIPSTQGVTVATKQPTALSGDRSNRVKYSCPQCGLNVWGKPAVRVACVDCEMELLANAIDSAGALPRGQLGRAQLMAGQAPPQRPKKTLRSRA